MQKDTVQLMITSPPYANFIRRSVADRSKTHKKSLIATENNSMVKPYSDDPRDFGNLSYDEFLHEMTVLIRKLYIVTKPGGYNVWVVKDYRDTKNDVPYIAFHSDLARIGEACGFRFHDLIVWDQNRQRSLVLLGYPSVFYTNQNCSFLVVFRKPQRHEGNENTKKCRGLCVNHCRNFFQDALRASSAYITFHVECANKSLRSVFRQIVIISTRQAISRPPRTPSFPLEQGSFSQYGDANYIYLRRQFHCSMCDRCDVSGPKAAVLTLAGAVDVARRD